MGNGQFELLDNELFKLNKQKNEFTISISVMEKDMLKVRALVDQAQEDLEKASKHLSYLKSNKVLIVSMSDYTKLQNKKVEYESKVALYKHQLKTIKTFYKLTLQELEYCEIQIMKLNSMKAMEGQIIPFRLRK